MRTRIIQQVELFSLTTVISQALRSASSGAARKSEANCVRHGSMRHSNDASEKEKRI